MNRALWHPGGNSGSPGSVPQPNSSPASSPSATVYSAPTPSNYITPDSTPKPTPEPSCSPANLQPSSSPVVPESPTPEPSTDSTPELTPESSSSSSSPWEQTSHEWGSPSTPTQTDTLAAAQDEDENYVWLNYFHKIQDAEKTFDEMDG